MAVLFDFSQYELIKVRCVWHIACAMPLSQYLVENGKCANESFSYFCHTAQHHTLNIVDGRTIRLYREIQLDLVTIHNHVGWAI